jgi:hypothetical protein
VFAAAAQCSSASSHQAAHPGSTNQWQFFLPPLLLLLLLLLQPFEFTAGESVSVFSKVAGDTAGGLFAGGSGPKPPPALSTAVIGMKPGGKVRKQHCLIYKLVCSVDVLLVGLTKQVQGPRPPPSLSAAVIRRPARW